MSDKIEKSGWPTLVNTYDKGSSPVDLDMHLKAAKDESAKPYLNLIKAHCSGMKDFEISEMDISRPEGLYKMSLSKKTDPNAFSGVLRSPMGEIVQEFNNQSPEIISSITAAKLGDYGMEKNDSNNAFEAMNNISSAAAGPSDGFEKLELANAAPTPPPPTPSQNFSNVVSGGSANTSTPSIPSQPINTGLASALGSVFKAEDEVLMENPHKKNSTIELEINDGVIKITLSKSEKEKEDMSFTDELTKAMDMKKKQAPAAQEAEQKDPKMAKKPAAPEAEEGTLKKDPEELMSEEGMEDSENTEEPMEQEDVDSAVESVDEGADNVQNKDALLPLTQNGNSDGELGDDPMEDENHEYIKMSTHNGGKQFWYKDQNGRIIEKPNAPEGHADFDHGNAMAELNQKLDMMMEKMEEILGEDIDGDMEVGEDEQHQEQVLGEEAGLGDEANEEDGGLATDDLAKEEGDLLQVDETEAKDKGFLSDESAPEVNPSKPEMMKKKPAPAVPEKKMPQKKDIKKSLYEAISQLPSTLETPELLEKAYKGFKKVAEAAAEGGAKDPAAVAAAVGRKKYGNEAYNSMIAAGKPGGNKGKKALKKSRFDRMWKVFKINMPESLDNTTSVEQANVGIRKLQKCILNQGKSQDETNRIVNRAIIEKYNLLNKGFNNFKNYQEWLGGNSIKETTAPNTPREMEDLRQKDAENRFGIREYSPEKTALVVEKSLSGIEKRVSEIINPAEPKWDNFKTYQEPMEKSEPSDFQKSRQNAQEKRWNMPDFKEPGSVLINEKKTSINDRVKNETLKKSENVTFDHYKKYDEQVVKTQSAPKTDSEKMNETIESNNWSVKIGEDK